MKTTVEITPDYVLFGNDKFDSRLRYFRTKPSGGEMAFVSGRTMFLGKPSTSVFRNSGGHYRYSCNGYVVSGGWFQGSASGNAVVTLASTE